MPGPYDRSHPSSAPTGPDQEHPFLTPNGYRLMRDRKRVATATPRAFPTYPPIQYAPGDYPVGEYPNSQYPNPQYPNEQSFHSHPGQPIPVDQFGQPIHIGQPGPSIHPNSVQPFSTENERIAERLQNTLPSKEFPDPTVLAHTPLTSYYATRRVTDSQKDPLRAIGKLLIQVSDNPNSEPATGSAWIAGPSLVITSAHNLYEFSTGRWSRSIEFHPGFDYYSQKELPTCRIISCCIPKGYMHNPTTNNDIAACFVDRNIGDIVGAEIPMRPVKENSFFEDNPVTIVGYPAGSSFDFGKQMWQSRGKYLFGRRAGPADDYSPVMATDFGGGSSGCPWLVKDKKSGKYVSVGVTSAHAKLHYDKGEPNLMSLISPYFGDRLFNSLSHDHEFHEFEIEDAG